MCLWLSVVSHLHVTFSHFLCGRPLKKDVIKTFSPVVKTVVLIWLMFSTWCSPIATMFISEMFQLKSRFFSSFLNRIEDDAGVSDLVFTTVSAASAAHVAGQRDSRGSETSDRSSWVVCRLEAISSDVATKNCRKWMLLGNFRRLHAKDAGEQLKQLPMRIKNTYDWHTSW